MTDTTILYAGIFCFALMVLGLALTIREFKNMSRARARLPKSAPVEAPPDAPAKLSPSRGH